MSKRVIAFVLSLIMFFGLTTGFSLPAFATSEAEQADNGEVVSEELTDAASDDMDQTTSYSESVKEETDMDVESETLTDAEDVSEDEEAQQEDDNFSYTTGGVTVSVTSPGGVFPEGTVMSVRRVSLSSIEEAVDSLLPDQTEITDGIAVDITFSNGGEEIQPTDPEKVHVTIRTKDQVEGEELTLIHINDEGVAEEVESTELSEELATFDSVGFSIYAIIGTDGKQDDDAVRRIYHFMQWDYSANSWTEIENQVQILKNGDKIVEPNEPASTFAGGDNAADDEQFEGWVITGNAPSTQRKDVSGGAPLEYKVITDINESATADEEVYVYAFFKVAYKAAFFDQNPSTATGDVGIVDVLVSTDYTDGEAIDVSRMTEIVKTQEGKAVARWYLRGRGGNAISGYPNTVAADDKTTLKFSELKQTVFLYPDIVNAITVSFDKNDSTTNSADLDTKTNATFTKAVKLAPGLKINAPTEPAREGYTFGGWYKNRACTGSAVNFNTETFNKDTTLYAKWVPKKVQFRVILWEETVDDEYGKQVGNRNYKYVSTYTDTTQTAGTQVTWALARSNFYTHYTTSQIQSMFPYHVYPSSVDDIDGDLFIAGDGSSIFNIYFNLKEYKLTFNVNNGSRQGTITHNGTQYHGSTYSFTAKMGEKIADKWPDAGEVSDITSGRTTYQFTGWKRSGSTTLYVTSRDELVPELLNTSGGSYVDTTFTANYSSSSLYRAYIRYYLQKPNGSGYELSNEYSQYVNTANRSNWNHKEIEGFTYYRAPSDNGKYDSNLKAYVWSFYYNRNTYDMVFINYDEISKTTDKTRSGLAYGADISGEYYVPNKPESLAGKDYISFDGWYLDEYYQARFDENGSFASKTMPDGNLTLYAKWKKGNVNITFNAKGGRVEGKTNVTRTVEAESKLDNAPDDPVRDGYEFLGWYDQSGNAFDSAEPFTANTTFYADWKSLDQFRVKYEVPEGEQGTAREDIYLYFDGANTSVNKIVNQKRTGYNFVGWKFRDGGDGTIYHENEMITIDSDLADSNNVIWLQAVYSTGVPIITKVTFDGNGGKDSSGQTSINVNATVSKYGNIQNNEWTTLAADTFTNEGYRFVEWNTKPDGSGISFASSKSVGADIIGESETDYNTLYAIWEQAEADYTLNYYIERLPGETPQSGDILINGHYYGEVVYTATGTDLIGTTVMIPPVKLTGAEENKDDTKSYAESHGQTTTEYEGYLIVVDKIKADGSTTLNYFYSRSKFKVSYTYAGVIPSTANPSADDLATKGGEYVYGQQVPVIDAATANAYDFAGWHSTDVDGDIQGQSFTMPANDVEIFGLFTPHTWGATAYIRYYVEIPNNGKVANTAGAITLDESSVDLDNGEPDYTQKDQSYNFIVTGKDGQTRYYQLPAATTGRQYELVYPATVGDTVIAPTLSFAGVELDWGAVKASTDYTKGVHDTDGDTTLSAVIPNDGVTYVSLYYNLVENPVSYYYLNDEVPSDASPASDALPVRQDHKYGDVVSFESRGTAKGYSFTGWIPDADITVIKQDGSRDTVASGNQVPVDAESYVMPNGPVNFIGRFSINKYKYKILHYQEILDQNSTSFDYQSADGIKYELVETQTTDADGNDLDDYYNTEVTAAQRSYEGFSFNSDISTQRGQIVDYEDEKDMLTLSMFYDRNELEINYAYAGTVPSGVQPAEDALDYLTSRHRYGTEIKAADLEPTDSVSAPGYTFNGWYADEDCTEEAADFTIKSATTFYGKFVPNDNTPYFEEHWLECLDQDNPGTGAVEVDGVWYELKERQEKAGTTDENVSGEPKDYEGYVWNELVSETEGVVSGAPESPLIIHNYYNRKILQITYAYAGTVPDGASPTTEELEKEFLTRTYGATLSVDDADLLKTDEVSAIGYTFAGWYTDENCTSSLENLTVTDNQTLYGKFIPEGQIPYTVEFYYMVKGEYPTDPNKTDTRYGDAGSLVNVTMDDLYPDEDHQGKDYEADADNENTVMYGYVAGDGSLKLKIYFKQEFTVNYLRGSYGDFTDIDNLPEGDEHAADGKTHFPNTSYGTSMADLVYNAEFGEDNNPLGKGDAEFEGWVADVDLTIDGTNVDAGTLISADDVTKIDVTQSFNLTAQWKLTYDITYTDNADGTVFDDQTTEVRAGKEVPGYVDAISGATEPARSGYVFKGWTADVDVTDKDGNTIPAGTVLGSDDIANLVADKAVIFSAQWKQCDPVTGILSDPPVKKTVTGDSAPSDDTFTFTLSAVSNTAGLSVSEMPMPEGSSGSTKTTPGLKAGEEYEFGDIEFTLLGTYVYEIKEVNDGKAKYTYDDSVYTVTYVVTQEGDTLSCERSIAKDGVDAGDIATFSFENTYEDDSKDQDDDDDDTPDDDKDDQDDDDDDTPDDDKDDQDDDDNNTPDDDKGNQGDDSNNTPNGDNEDKGDNSEDTTTTTTAPTEVTSVKTGDDNALIIWLIICSACVGGIAIIVSRRKVNK